MIEPTLVVLAAGMGSRFGGLKQTVGFGPHGETLLDYSVFDAVRAGFGKVVFVIRRDFADAFRRNVAARFEPHLAVDCVFQDRDDVPTATDGRPLVDPAALMARSKPWGTGHATLAARHAVTTPFGVINADDFYGRDALHQLAHFLRQSPPQPSDLSACLVAFTLRNTLSHHGKVARGVCRTSPDGHLLAVEEKTHLWPVDHGAENRPDSGPVESFTGDEPVSLNTWGFTPSLLPELEKLFADFLTAPHRPPEAEFFLPFAVDQLIRDGRLQCQVLRTHSRWFGVTYREDTESVRTALAHLHAASEYPEPLWE
ncbi:MAG: NDP-sugar synthase [Verrucomicrobiales bacterium]